MAQVWRRTCGVTVLVRNDGQRRRRGASVARDENGDGVAAQRAAATTGEDGGRSGARRRSANQTRSTEHTSVVSGVIRSLRPLPWQRRWAPVPSSTSAQVSAVSSETRRPGLDGDEQQRVVSTTEPGVAIGRGEEGVDLVVGEERDELSVGAFGRDGEHPLDQRRVFGMSQRRVGEQRVDGGQAVVAGAHAVVPFSFQVIEEGADHDRVEVLQAELRRRLADAALGEAEEQTERVAIGGDRVGAGPALADEAIGEEALHDRSERAHRCAMPAASRRAATRLSSSGAADRYQ